MRGGKFAAVTTAAQAASLAPDARRLDVKGKWLIPGLIDAHVHYYEWMDEAFLGHGVTTVRDVGANADRILDLRRRSRADDAKGPRLFACGPLIDGGTPRHGLEISVSVTTEAEAAREARRVLALGVDCLKVYEQLTLPHLRAVRMWGGRHRDWALDGPRSTAAMLSSASAVDVAFLEQVEANVAPADPAVLIYTSGSTAEPKGAVHTHGSLVRHSFNVLQYIDFAPGDRLYASMPLFPASIQRCGTP